VGLGENDPLRKWSQNLTPQQFQQFQALHAQGDPEGAKQALIDQGVPPPTDHYPAGPVPMTRAATEPDVPPQPYPGTPPPPGRPGHTGEAAGQWIREKAGQVGSYFSNPPNPQYGKNPMSPAFPNYGSNPPPPQPEPNPNPVAQGATPLPTARPAGAPKKQTIETDDGSKITIEHGKGAGDNLNPPETGQVPTPKPDPRKTLAGREKTKLEEGLDAAGEAGKQFQGVKAPPRPELPKIGAPGVRSPVSVNPAAVNQLLGLVGQNVNPQQARLMQLLGRAV